MELSKIGMLVRLKTSFWGGEILDRSITNQAIISFSGVAGAGRFTKQLIDKKSLAPLQGARSAVMAIHHKHSLPWADEGTRVITTHIYTDYMSEVGSAIRRFDSTADIFCEPATWAAEVNTGPTRLGSAFDPAEYPSAQEVRNKYSMKLSVMPFPNTVDWRLALGDEQAECIREQATRDVNRSVEEAVGAIHSELVDALKHLVTKLSSHGPGKKFHATALTEVLRIADILPKLNLTGNEALNSCAREVYEALEGVNIQDLRELPVVRGVTQSKAEELIRKLTF